MRVYAFIVALGVSSCSSLYVTIATSFLFVKNASAHASVIGFLLGFTNELFGVSNNELQHMTDVRFLFFLSSLIFMVNLVFWLLLRRERLNAYPLWYTIFPAILVGIALIFFNTSFILFHKLLFTNTFWIFPPESWIIQLYPESFFAFCAIIWFIVTGIFLYVCSK